jgi:hypothetical protein
MEMQERNEVRNDASEGKEEIYGTGLQMNVK